MPIVTAGRDKICSLISGLSTDVFSNANACIGVGDGTAAFDAAQTDLQGTNKTRVHMDTGFPTQAANVLTFQSTFSETQANYAWQEWGIFNAETSGTMLSRKVEYNGTKLAGQIWIITLTVTINIT
jgi:hypothetical protein